MSSPFDRFQRADAVPAPSPSAGPRVLVENPNARREQDRADRQEGRDAAQLGISAANAANSQRSTDISAGNSNRDAITSFSQQFRQDLRVRGFTEASIAFQGALRAQPNAAGDLSLINAYFKINDPNSAVMEGEADQARSVGTTVDQFMNTIGKELGLEGSGSFTPRDRRRLILEMANRVSARGQQYNLARQDFAGQARAAGVDPAVVLGGHAFTPVQADYTDWLNRNGFQRTPDGRMVRNAGQDDQLDGPMSIAVANEGQGDDPRAAFRFTTGQRDELFAYLRGNAGNLTADGINAESQRLGGGPLANAQEIADTLNAGGRINWALDYSQVDAARTAELDALARQRYGDEAGSISNSGDAFSRGAADTLTLGFGDEIGGAINTAVRGGSYEDNRDVLRYLGDRQSETNPWSRTAGQVAGGLVMPTRAGGAASAAGRTALRAGQGMDAARAAAATAGRGTLMREGAAYGAAYGAGSADGDIYARITGAAVGGAIGAVGGEVAGRVGNRIEQANVAARVAQRGQPGGTIQNSPADYLAAADRIGVTPFVADAGGPATRRMTAGLEQTVTGAGPIRRAADATIASAQAARDRVAQRIGQVLDSDERLGTETAQAAQREIRRMAFEASNEYGRARNLSQGMTVRPRQAYATLSAHIDELTDTGISQTGLTLLRNIQQRMEQGPIGIDTLRNMRSALRDDLVETGLRNSDISRRADQVLDDIGVDIEQALVNAGRQDAATAFRQADNAWREMNELAEQVVERIIGSDRQALSGEDVVRNLNRALQGNSVRAVRFLNALPDQARDTARASIIARMGQRAGQNTGETEFSLATFLTNWRNISEEPVRNALFGREGRAALQDLATVAENAQLAQRYRNTSNTAGAVPNPPTAGDVVTGFARYWGPNVTARMMTSQRFVRWLAAAPRKPNIGAQRQHVQRLTALARTEPVIAADIQALQTRLLEQFSPERVAASPDAGQDVNDPRRDVPPSQRGN